MALQLCRDNLLWRCIIGFEVNYKYHEKIDGEYNKEEMKDFKKKVGDPFEDISLEKLAMAIMSQLARRDVLIVDVVITELSKKSVSFKEAKGGLVIKNKKFLFDSELSENVIVEDVKEEADVTSSQSFSLSKPQVENQPVKLNLAENTRPRLPITWMTYTPEERHTIALRKYKLTLNKKYGILSKISKDFGYEVLKLIDDTGKEIEISGDHFVPANTSLLYGDLKFDQSDNEEIDLNFRSENFKENMPNIRR